MDSKDRLSFYLDTPMRRYELTGAVIENDDIEFVEYLVGKKLGEACELYPEVLRRMAEMIIEALS